MSGGGFVHGVWAVGASRAGDGKLLGWLRASRFREGEQLPVVGKLQMLGRRGGRCYPAWGVEASCKFRGSKGVACFIAK
jgi:hypothetical protein